MKKTALLFTLGLLSCNLLVAAKGRPHKGKTEVHHFALPEKVVASERDAVPSCALKGEYVSGALSKKDRRKSSSSSASVSPAKVGVFSALQEDGLSKK